ncbi:MAG: PqqD family peptide modification chaperone [Microgenomates group bacterium]
METLSRSKKHWQHDLIQEKSVVRFIKGFLKKKAHKNIETLPPKGAKVALLVSGGFDSVALWFYLLDHYGYEVYPLYCIDKKNRKKNEEAAADHYSKLFRNLFPHNSHNLKKIPINSKFTFRSTSMNKVNPLEILAPHLFLSAKGIVQNTLLSTPFRLLHYIIAAHNVLMEEKFNKNTNIEAIFVGFVGNDKVTRESTLSVVMTINLFVSLVLGEYGYRFIAPIDRSLRFYLSKEDLARYAVAHNLDIYRTWSCDSGLAKQCGYCISCSVRKQTFKNIKVHDKTTYSSSGIFQKMKTIPKIVVRTIKKQLNKKKAIPLFGPASVIHISQDVYSKKINNTLYRFEKKNGYIEKLNETAEIIWGALSSAKGTSVGELYRILHKEYPHISKDKLEGDVDEFIRESMRKNYISLTS